MLFRRIQRVALFGSMAILMIVSSGCATTDESTSSTAYGMTGEPQLFNGLGEYSRDITTDSHEAQEYFNQGLNWMYSFNHDEAVRSFRRAAEIDDDCAMAWWAISYCQGPNYNDPVMTDDRSAAAWDALEEAHERSRHGAPVERALIEALGHRYESPWPEDRTALEQSFADAMSRVWAEYPDDPDVGAVYAEALMTQRPWKLYTIDKRPEKDTPTIVATLERVLTLAPHHPGANHLYIHAIEPSENPDRALPAADRLCDLVPGAGHMNHMPTHIYVQTGMWDRSIEQNAKAMDADSAYRERSPDQLVQHMYMVHNSHMLAFSAMMVGREAEAMTAARAMWEDVPEETLAGIAPFVDLWMTSVYDVQKRFGRWDDILAEPAPPTYLPITTAIWRAHRSIAYAAKQDFGNAEHEYELFKAARESIPSESVFGQDATHRILEVSDYFIRGEIALQQRQWDKASKLLEEAARIEDTLWYGEPPQWLQPVRHTLGAMYLAAGRYADAERVYRDDLKKWRGNGWSLYGLSRALEQQGKEAEARRVRSEYQQAWAKADEPTRTSCKCIPET
ncbi:MAG: tetratricopeptide repeat protein [Phycisphaerales bacterium]